MAAPAAGASSTAESADGVRLRILHFNDVYNIDSREREPCGGIARFKTLMEARRRKAAEDGVACLTCFSGDALYPSTLSTLTHARQMVDAMNVVMGKHGIAGVGNHDCESLRVLPVESPR